MCKAYFQKKFNNKSGMWNRRSVLLHILLFLLILASAGFIWMRRIFGGIGIAEIIFTMTMPTRGATGMTLRFVLTVLLPSIVIFAIVTACEVRFAHSHKIGTKLKRATRCAGYAWVLVLVLIANMSYGILEYVNDRSIDSTFVEDEYVNTADADISFPNHKKNVIIIYLESGETSYHSIADGGFCDIDYTPEMTELARSNTSFSQNNNLAGAQTAPGTGWTMAALMAQTSGVPLMVPDRFQDINNDFVVSGLVDTRMYGVTALGDVLKANGYENYFMVGSDFSYGGREEYFRKHGVDTIYDLNSPEYANLPQDSVEKNDWGYADRNVFALAKEQLPEIAKTGTPFSFSMLTSDTHTPDGYSCELCRNDCDSRYANVWGCSSRQTFEFVEWCKKQDFYEDTVIVIAGDHLTMQANFFAADKEFNPENEFNKFIGSLTLEEVVTNPAPYERGIYNVIINSDKTAVSTKNRQFTTMDMFPTVLSAMGADIKGDRLGLGTDLYSSTPTLAEEYGIEALRQNLEEYSPYYYKNIMYKN